MSECKHKRYDARLHSYCPDCGVTGIYVEHKRMRAEIERLQWLLLEARDYMRDSPQGLQKAINEALGE